MGPDARAIGEYARWTLRPRLQTVEGVGNIFLGGFQEREIRVWVDQERLEGYGLTAGEVVSALQSQNVEVPGGALESGARETVVKIQGEVSSVAAFEDLVVAMRGRRSDPAPGHRAGRGRPRADPRLRPLERRGRDRSRHRAALGGQHGGGVAGGARATGRARGVVPRGMEAEIAYDGAEYIERSIADAQLDLLYGAFFAMVVVLLFLRSWRSTLIIGLAIPTSLLGTFAFMSFFGFTINTMTLALAVGVVIDDAIVVLENIYRNMEEGKPPAEAAAFGTQEIALAVAATTFSPGGRLPAGGVHGRHRGPLPVPVRRHGGDRDPPVTFRRADPDADALLAVPPTRGAAQGPCVPQGGGMARLDGPPTAAA